MSEKMAPPAMPFPSNIEIAQQAKLRPIVPLARERLGIPEESLEPYGRYKAKVSLDYLAQLADRPDGKKIDAGDFATSAKLATGTRLT